MQFETICEHCEGLTLENERMEIELSDAEEKIEQLQNEIQEVEAFKTAARELERRELTAWVRAARAYQHDLIKDPGLYGLTDHQARAISDRIALTLVGF